MNAPVTVPTDDEPVRFPKAPTVTLTEAIHELPAELAASNEVSLCQDVDSEAERPTRAKGVRSNGAKFAPKMVQEDPGVGPLVLSTALTDGSS